jgi:hypothetical protein
MNQADTTGVKHADRSDVTGNICLETSDDLQGSQVLFYGTQPSLFVSPQNRQEEEEEGTHHQHNRKRRKKKMRTIVTFNFWSIKYQDLLLFIGVPIHIRLRH